VDELTVVLVRRWRENAFTSGGHHAFRATANLLRSDTRLQTGPVADELARRVRMPTRPTQSYSEAEFDRIKMAARRTFRTALARIEHNAQHLRRWRDKEFAEGSGDWVIGEALEILARTGSLPQYIDKSGHASLVWRYRGRGRRTVIALDRREPGQHSKNTHDRHYVLVDKRVQDESGEVIAAGAQDAVDRASTAVLVATLRDEPRPGDVQTVTADCSDYANSPYPTRDRGCGASFLMCLACVNAHVLM
jgi:hypothetical protein